MKTRSVLLRTTAIALLSAAMTISPKASAQAQSTNITVHLPRMPHSGYNFSYTYSLPRTTTNPRPEIGALQQIFNGPTPGELAVVSGLQAPIGGSVSPTACASPPVAGPIINAGRFQVKRLFTGSNIEYRIRFCQPFTIGGVGDTALLLNAIEDTLWGNLPSVGFGVNNITAIKVARSDGLCINNPDNVCW